jgi:hypothetical protein
VQYAKDVQQKLTFMAPFVAIALREMPVKNVQRQHKITSRRLCQSPAIPIILSNDPNEWSKKKKTFMINHNKRMRTPCSY